MKDMDAAGKPVDPVTIVWEAARRGLRADARRLEGGTGPFAISSAREVYKHAVLAHAAQAGRDIQADAADPACTPRLLVHSTGERLLAVESELRSVSHPAREARDTEPAGVPHPQQPPHPEREAV
jgi:hypothetical protein